MTTTRIKNNRKISVEKLISVSLPPYVVLEGGLNDKGHNRSFGFFSLKKELGLESPSGVEKFFSEVETYLMRGYWLAGFFSYEFGYCLEDVLKPLLPEKRVVPLVWLGVFDEPLMWTSRRDVLRDEGKRRGEFIIEEMRPAITEEYYQWSVRKIKKYIEEGDTYQVNFTFPIKFTLKGEVYPLYSYLRQAQPTPYMAFINTGRDYVFSFSPELFFCVNNFWITVRPMKGTIARGRFIEEDRVRLRALRMSTKNRAENVMIVDLLRNDLGRIAEKGTVTVRNLFSLERYPTLFQMTSTIEAKLREDIRLYDLFSSLFPCGSVTGAPKIRTMQIIKEVERYPRGVYCGAIGYISPYGQMCFNVAIRTLHINQNKEGTLGVGGGIVYDSRPSKEFEEALLKAKFFIKPPPSFMLVETIRATRQDGFYLLDLHLRRLKRSCRYFDINVDINRVKTELARVREKFEEGEVYIVRILVSRGGEVFLEHRILEKKRKPLRVKLVKTEMSGEEVYLYHKTTYRPFYEKVIKEVRREGFDEALLINRKGEVTEGTFTNVFIKKGGTLYTPPVKCGLLPGVLREHLLRTGAVQERVLYLQDILQAEKVFMGNSVRGLLDSDVVCHKE